MDTTTGRRNDADKTYAFGNLKGTNLTVSDMPKNSKQDTLTVINTFGIYYQPEMKEAAILIPTTDLINGMIIPFMWLYKKDADAVLADVHLTKEGQKESLAALRNRYKDRVNNLATASTDLFNNMTAMRRTALHRGDYVVKNEMVDCMRAVEVRSYFRDKEVEVKTALANANADPFIVWSLEGSPVLMTDAKSIADARLLRCTDQQLIADTDEALGFINQAIQAVFSYLGIDAPAQIKEGLKFSE